jgi:diguanylate cyclase (GGDEF)-like protein
MLEGILEVSAQVAEADDPEDILQAVCDGIRDALGFDKVVIELAPRPDMPLVPAAWAGWHDDPGVSNAITLDALAPLLTDEFEIAGCYLVPTEVADERLKRSPGEYDSELYGRGPNAWSRHWLIVPLTEPQGRRRGLIWVDHPRDRLLPTRARLQALRLFANQAMSALHSADQVVRLRYEATHDPLTSLPNRRALLARLPKEVEASGRSNGNFALVLCDMDNLKVLNDTLGHEAGDVALQLLAGALRSGLRRGDDAYRLGGDEFAVVLPRASREDAERVTRRLREATVACAAGRVKSIDASFGIAMLEPGESPDRLMARADEALYRDKRRRDSAA